MRRLEVAVALLCLLAARCVFAQDAYRVDVLAYYGYSAYDDGAQKDYAHLGGLYGSLGYGLEHVFEGEADYAYITYRDDSSLTQYDFTAAYSNFSLPNIKLRVGGHALLSDDDLTDRGWVAFAGATYYQIAQWDAGLDAFYSRYENYEPRLQVLQFTPHAGLTFWKNEKRNSAFRLDVKGHAIRLDEDVSVGEGQVFYSGEGRLALFVGDWSCGVFGWMGDQMFAVRQDGFAVYNLPEKHTGGYGGDLRLPLTQRFAVTFRVAREMFDDLATREKAGAWTGTVLASFTF
jgi:hypothetical protein